MARRVALLALALVAFAAPAVAKLPLDRIKLPPGFGIST